MKKPFHYSRGLKLGKEIVERSHHLPNIWRAKKL